MDRLLKKNDRKDDVNSAKSNQESGAAESSKDKQTKDSNSGTGEVPVKRDKSRRVQSCY